MPADGIAHRAPAYVFLRDVGFRLHADNRRKHAEPWRVTLVNTGEDSMTGGRLKRVYDYVKDEQAFCFTYGDGVSDVNIAETIAFHREHGKLATVTAVQPPGRYGALQLSGEKVQRFAEQPGGDRRKRQRVASSGSAVQGFVEKPRGDGGLINGGFFVLSPRCIDRIAGDSTTWEAEPLSSLAAEGQLMAYAHTGFWQPMDTLREKNLLEDLWQTGNAPWKKW